MSFTLKSQPLFSSHCLSARFTLLSRRKPVNVILCLSRCGNSLKILVHR